MSQFICIDGPGSLVQAKLLSKRLQAKGCVNVVVSGQQLGGPAGYFINRYQAEQYGKPTELNAYHVVKIFGLTFLDIRGSITRLLGDGITIICYDYVASAVLSAARSIKDKPSRNGFYLWCDQYFFQSLTLPRPEINVVMADAQNYLAQELYTLQPKDYKLIKISSEFGVAQTHSKISSMIFGSSTQINRNSKTVLSVQYPSPNKTENETLAKPANKIGPIYLQEISKNKLLNRTLNELRFKLNPVNRKTEDGIDLINYQPINELEVGMDVLKSKTSTYLQKQSATLRQFKKYKSKDSKRVKINYTWKIRTNALILGTLVQIVSKENISNIKFEKQLSSSAKNQLIRDNLEQTVYEVEQRIKQILQQPRKQTPIILGQLVTFELNLSYTQIAQLFKKSKFTGLKELESILSSMLYQIGEDHPLGHQILIELN